MRASLFYYAWAPDSSALVALAATIREWQYLRVLRTVRAGVHPLAGRG